MSDNTALQRAIEPARNSQRTPRPEQSRRSWFADFTTITRSQALTEPSDVTNELAQAALNLLTTRLPAKHLPVWLLGMGASGLQSQLTQGLLLDAEERQKRRQLDDVADRIKERFGGAELGRASSMAKGDRRKSPGP